MTAATVRTIFTVLPVVVFVACLVWWVIGDLVFGRQQRDGDRRALAQDCELLIARYERGVAEGRYDQDPSLPPLPDTWGPVPGVTEHAWHLVSSADELRRPVKARERFGCLYIRPYTTAEWRTWANSVLPRRRRRALLARLDAIDAQTADPT